MRNALWKSTAFDVDANEDTDFTRVLQNIASGSELASIKAKSTRNIELARTIDHMKYSSGFYNLIYKVHSFWGYRGVVKLLTHFHDDFFQKYRAGEAGTKDARNWVVDHLADYLGTKLEDYFSIEKCISKTIIPSVPSGASNVSSETDAPSGDINIQ